MDGTRLHIQFKRTTNGHRRVCTAQILVSRNKTRKQRSKRYEKTMTNEINQVQKDDV